MICPKCNSNRYSQVNSDFGNYMLCVDCDYVDYTQMEVVKTEPKKYILLKKGDRITADCEYWNDKWLPVKHKRKWIGTEYQGDDDVCQFRRVIQ